MIHIPLTNLSRVHDVILGLGLPGLIVNIGSGEYDYYTKFYRPNVGTNNRPLLPQGVTPRLRKRIAAKRILWVIGRIGRMSGRKKAGVYSSDDGSSLHCVSQSLPPGIWTDYRDTYALPITRATRLPLPVFNKSKASFKKRFKSSKA